ncbi:MAG: S8/S53 family peptidase, partial [Gemmatimonadaceae bacterium]|nr:S8/S53 family peptidase [Gemmatimonadaceae bacterium]
MNLQFRPSATNAQRRAFQVNFNAQLVGVFGTVYQFRLPDLGASYSSFRARIEQIGSDSTVLRARAVSVFDRAASFGSRYPDDAPQFRRSNYVNRDSSVWVATALRLPQAWSCETGQYGGILPRIAIFEQNFPLVPASDVSRSLLTPVIRDTSWRTAQLVTTVPADSARYTSHGHSVAALVSASGDDSTGLAGPLWRSDLRVITPGNVNEKKGAGAFFFYEVLSQEILRAAPRILSLSSDYVINPDTLQREADIVAITLRFRQLLDSLPMLLIVQAVGNDGYQGSYAARDTSLRNIFQEALVAIRSGSTTYRDRIVFVGETDRNGNRPTESNEFSGLIDLYAPGFGVPILLADGTVAIGRGTSFAAPIVAGIAGQLLAMDPTLSAKDLKDLLRRAEDS